MSAARAAGPASSVVFALAYETWADAVSRGMSWSANRMLERLLPDPDVSTLLVSDPLRSQLSRLRRRGPRARAGFPDDPTRDLLHPRRLRRRDSFDRHTTAAEYRRFDRWLHQQAVRRRMEAVLVTCHPVHAAVADRSRWRDVVYYGWDDWLAYPPYADAEDLFRWSYEQMVDRDVNVIGVTRALVERIGAPRSTVVPNGMSSSDFRDLPEPPTWFTDLTGPVAMYAGSLEQRIDVDALLACARDLPDWTFVLVGYLAEPALFADLVARPNVILRGLEPRPRVLAMMQHADVCLIPHRKTPMSVSMSPLKLYEYLGAGSAVVGIDLPPLRGISERCLLVAEGEPLAPAVRRAAALPPVERGELEMWRERHDWDRRYVSWRAACLGAVTSARSV